MDTQSQVENSRISFTEAQLRGLVRRKLIDGVLREDVAHDAWGGISIGGHCAACDAAIPEGGTEIRTFVAEQAQRYHPRCHLVLSVELEGLAQR